MADLILAIDPGSSSSGWMVLRDGKPALVGDVGANQVECFGKATNEEVLVGLRRGYLPNGILCRPNVVVIEYMSPRGLPTSAQEMETLWWAGRFAEAAYPVKVERLTRDAVKFHLCGRRSKVNDTNVRAALIDRFGGTGGKDAAIGRKASPGPMYGVTGDAMAALAVAVSWADGAR